VERGLFAVDNISSVVEKTGVPAQGIAGQELQECRAELSTCLQDLQVSCGSRKHKPKAYY